MFSAIAPSNEDGGSHFLPQMPHFSHTPAPYNGPSGSDLLKKRKQYLPTSAGPYYTHPVSTFLISLCSVLSDIMKCFCRRIDSFLNGVAVKSGGG